MPVINNDVRVFQLHLELEARGADMPTLKKWGKVKNTISRDVLVSPAMPLFALHFVIQKCFGWQNSHLHHFEFPSKVLQKLVKDSFKEYCKYCGLYFRFPYENDDETLADIYWYDDYSGEEAPVDWLKSKYEPPFIYRGMSEHYMVAQSAVRSFFEENLTIRTILPFSEVMKGNTDFKTVRVEEAGFQAMRPYFENGMGELIERMTLWETIRPLTAYETEKGKKLGLEASFREAERIARERELAYETDYSHMDEIAELATKLQCAEEKLVKACRRKNSNPATVAKVSAEYQALKSTYEENAEAFFERTAPIMPPLAKELRYEYDYGDGWVVKITLAEDYRVAYEGEYLVGFYDAKGNRAEAVLEKMLTSVLERDVPVCVAADGLSVMDDVGGIGGYCDFLNTIHGEGDDFYEDAYETKEWARSMGWTGRMKKPSNIL